MKALRVWFGRYFSPGALVVLLIAITTSTIVALLPTKEVEGIPFWLTARPHFEAYRTLIDRWNRDHPDRKVAMTLLHGGAQERRMLAGFLSGTPVADLIEANLGIAAKAFIGPVESVGFLDLTERLHAEGIYELINTPSFAPYTTRGRIFGVPHDVHPVLLAYRADLVEAAGIDVSTIETWEDYFRVLRPLMKDLDGDGRPDRYLLSAWDTRGDTTTMIILQAGGDFFDEHDNPILNSDINAEVLARLVTWFTGPNRVCIDVDPYTASGHRQRLDGLVIGSMCPDWMAGSWKLENPALGGKIKLMPLPAWEKGGRRTSVAGGTMIGISKRSENIETCWELIQHLYLSPQLAEQTFRTTTIISPVKTLWNESFYDAPDPFFSGQPVGRMFIDQAPDVPRRSSSPYVIDAATRVTTALLDLRAYADRHHIYDEAALKVEAKRLLDHAQRSLTQLIERNAFLKHETP